MKIAGSVVLVTGANRGIGAEFVRQLKERGAAKIYAAARRVDTITAEGVEAVSLDVTDTHQVEAVATAAQDVHLLINNAGTTSGEPLLGGDLAPVRQELETNFFGPLNLTRAFSPILAANGGGAILNVLSAASWLSAPGATTYATTKAAAWSLTDGIRIELAAQGTHVLGLHMGVVDTDMTAGMNVDKVSPSAVVTAALDGLEAGAHEILADDIAAQVKTSLTLDPSVRYGEMLDTAA
ncbi:SDR family oxidoreductase [Rhodococcus sp. CH91]|uniref:SDR family oxidoreductase n=1 Tax=Rhodococcus sp. CH91 TaxID=2910256 RepID=UPI001F4B95FE|nr:SDR family oxidoreductase [Rhodococcus sp. CH91]